MMSLQQNIHLHILLIGTLLISAVLPVSAKAQPDEASRVDAYMLTVEDGEFVYVVGDAVNYGSQLPPGSLNEGGGMLDLWVAKLNKDGTPIFQAIIGGGADDIAYDVAVRQGVIYILGETWSTDFPSAPGNAGENDALVLALAADGGSLLWARRIGGSDLDSGRAITLRGTDLFVTGITWSQDLVPGAAQGDMDGFLARLDLSGGLQWLKQFGGNRLDASMSLAAGETGIWVTGETFSTNLAGLPAGNGDVFALRFDASGNQQFAGLYGGSGEDAAYGAALAPDGGLYIIADTQSNQLKNAHGQYGGGTDAVLFRLDSAGSLKSSSYLGGSGQDSGIGVAVLPNGDALALGGTHSPVFPLGYDHSSTGMGNEDIFLAQVNAAGDLVSIHLEGGSGEDEPRGEGITAGGVALSGSFSIGKLGYYLLIPADELTEIIFPTSGAPEPSATLAPSATLRPTETSAAGGGATNTPQPSNTPRPVIQNTFTATHSPTVPTATATATLAASPTVTATLPGGAYPLPTLTPSKTARGPVNPADRPQNPGVPLSVWVTLALALVLVSGLGGLVYWFNLKKPGNPNNNNP